MATTIFNNMWLFLGLEIEQSTKQHEKIFGNKHQEAMNLYYTLSITLVYHNEMGMGKDHEALVCITVLDTTLYVSMLLYG